MKSEKSARIQYLDVAKGFGIVMVCIGHACTTQSVTVASRWADIIRFVTLFHMALFFFINGMLYQTKYSEKPIRGSIKKFWAYYVPFVKYNLLFWLFHNLFAKLHLISGKLDAKDYAYEGVRAFVVSFIKSVVGFRQKFAGAMWFLEVLIVISVVFIFADFVATKLFSKKRIVFLTVAVLGIVLVNRLLNLSEMPYIPDSLSQMVYWGLNGLLFFFAGYLYRFYSWNEKLLNHKKWLAPLLLLVVVVSVIIMRPQVVSVITNHSVPIFQGVKGAFIGGKGTVGLPLLQYFIYAVVGLCGIIMVLLFSQFSWLSNSAVLKVLGKYSLHIMCLHFLAFKLVSLIIIWVYRLPIERLAEYPVVNGVEGFWWVAYTVCGCLLPVLVVKLFEVLKSKIVVGQRKRENA